MIPINRALGRLVYKPVIRRLSGFNVDVITPDGKFHNLNKHSSNEVTIQIKDWSFFWDVLLGFDLGFAGSYLGGKWNCDKLTELFNELSSSKATAGVNKFVQWMPSKLIARIVQRVRSSNSLWWAPRNIRKHYDISNHFFANFLDKSMTYSCGVFESTQDTLEDAQERKLAGLLQKRDLKRQDHILDIGCGWGSLITKAAIDYGCKCTGVTLSKNQYEYCDALIKSLNLQNNVEILLCDYRTINGSFDHIFAIEILEAVGHGGIDVFFRKCNELLPTKGTLDIQVINVPDDRYESYRKNCDFIQKYIFPGGLLPSLAVVEQSAHTNGFSTSAISSIGKHYVPTLEGWKRNLKLNWSKIQQSGFNLKDYRRFDYYFSYCSGAFNTGHIDNHQLSFIKST